jgi:NUMOD3 motif
VPELGAIFTGKRGAEMLLFYYKYYCTQQRAVMNFYTYAYLREDGTPYYIGKGKGRRIYNKGKNEVKPPKDKLRIIFLKKNLTEEESLKHEKYMIAILGRKDLGNGILRNKCDGGKSPTNLSQESRRKISEYHKSKILSDETKRKLSQTHRGKNNHFYGKKHSEETKKRLSEKHTGKKLSDEHKIKIGKSNCGKVLSNLTRQNIRESKTGNKNPAYGKRWWNDGCGNCKLSPECPGEGWSLGRGCK